MIHIELDQTRYNFKQWGTLLTQITSAGFEVRSDVQYNYDTRYAIYRYYVDFDTDDDAAIFKLKFL
jgi:hypothetical protein